MDRAKLLRAIAIEEDVRYRAWNLFGTPDDILEVDTINGPVRFVVDVKGANSRKFQLVKTSGKPIDGHEWQVHGYMQPKGLNRGILWYENKDTQEYCEIPVKRRTIMVKELRARYKLLMKHKKRDTLPPNECSMRGSDPMYSRCPQRVNCMKITRQEGKL
jgi:hypothetical protein